MRHLKAHRQLGRNSAHRHAMFSNMVVSLFQHGQIETTEAKAKELRGVADRAISWAKSVGELTAKKGKLGDDERAKIVHAKRMARRVVKDAGTLDLLFAEIGPRMAGRPGGYTRLLKTRFRVGDAAPMALIQLVDYKLPEAAPAPEPDKKGKKAAAAETETKAAKKAKAPAKKKAKDD